MTREERIEDGWRADGGGDDEVEEQTMAVEGLLCCEWMDGTKPPHEEPEDLKKVASSLRTIRHSPIPSFFPRREDRGGVLLDLDGPGKDTQIPCRSSRKAVQRRG